MIMPSTMVNTALTRSGLRFISGCPGWMEMFGSMPGDSTGSAMYTGCFLIHILLPFGSQRVTKITSQPFGTNYLNYVLIDIGHILLNIFPRRRKKFQPKILNKKSKIRGFCSGTK